MAKPYVINVDLANVYRSPDGGRSRKQLVRTLAWGDEVQVVEITATHVEVEITELQEQPDGSIAPQRTSGFIVPSRSSGVKPAGVVIPKKENKVLKVDFVDVQQGDGSVIEKPDGTVILVDGGDNQLFARYLASRYGGTTPTKRKKIDLILVTHGDADHFAGLTKIRESETYPAPKVYKRFHMQPLRVYHNGLVKRPGTMDDRKVPDKELLGATTTVGADTVITDLVDDLLSVPEEEMNGPFKRWRNALEEYAELGPIDFKRLEFGMDDAFDGFFNSDRMWIEVLGPLTVKDNDGNTIGLKFLGDPPHGPTLGHESVSDEPLETKGHSASHTINGHSIVFRLVYGGFSYLFCGDLNNEAGRFLARQHNLEALNLRSEVFKVPHHGSADFSGAFFQCVQPIVSVVSSGDENERKEYIHPRATLMGALGKHSRVPEPLIFVTEMVAFFRSEGYSQLSDPAKRGKRGEFYGFSRTAFGIVMTRTDGDRLLVYTNSGNVSMKEAYAYQLDENGIPQPAPIVKV